MFRAPGFNTQQPGRLVATLPNPSLGDIQLFQLMAQPPAHTQVHDGAIVFWACLRLNTYQSHCYRRWLSLRWSTPQLQASTIVQSSGVLSIQGQLQANSPSAAEEMLVQWSKGLEQAIKDDAIKS